MSNNLESIKEFFATRRCINCKWWLWELEECDCFGEDLRIPTSFNDLCADHKYIDSNTMNILKCKEASHE